MRPVEPRLGWRRPRVEGSAGEAALADATAQRREAGARAVLDVFGGLEPTAVPIADGPSLVAAPGAVDRLGIERVIEAVLARGPVDGGVVQLSSPGRGKRDLPEALTRRLGGPTTATCALTPGLAEAVRGGETVIVNGLGNHGGPLEALLTEWEWAQATRHGANAYIGGGVRSAFGPHWDDHDLLIVPVWGSKHWTVRDPVAPSPAPPIGLHRVGDHVAWQGWLAPGEVLLLPSGFGHDTEGDGHDVCHVSIWRRHPRGFDVARLALSAVPTVTPTPWDEMNAAGPPSVGEWSEAAEAAVALWWALTPPRPTSPLRSALEAGPVERTRLNVSTPGGIALETSGPGTRIALGGWELPVTASLLFILASLLRVPGSRPVDAGPVSSRDREALERLVAAGLLSLSG